MLALRDDVEVGRVILAGSRQMSLRGYGIGPQLAELALEIVFFEVACQYRRQGIGREIVQALCRRYPDRRLVAFSEGVDEFWESVGQRHEHKGLIEPRNRPLFIMERATSDGA